MADVHLLYVHLTDIFLLLLFFLHGHPLNFHYNFSSLPLSYKDCLIKALMVKFNILIYGTRTNSSEVSRKVNVIAHS